MNIALDLDGTLISCEQRQSAVLRAALIHFGIQADLKVIWDIKRAGASTEKALIQVGFEPTLAHRVVLEWQRVIEQPVWLAFDSTLPGVVETLLNMKTKGMNLWLLTARSRPEWVPQQLARLGLRPLLDHVRVVSSLEVSKAKAAILRDISAAAFFGDTESDARASISADVPFFAVASGQRDATFLAKGGFGSVHDDLSKAWGAFIMTCGMVSNVE